MDEHAWACPWRGHLASEQYAPQTTTALAETEDTKDPKGILKEFKNTEVESEADGCADKILNFCEALSCILLLLHIISGIAMLFSAFVTKSASDIFYALLVWGVGIISYYVIKYIGKCIWSFMKLFVNISTTCKRIEIILEKKDSQKEP